MKIAIFSVVPSPYQRDLFSALAARPNVDLNVFYLEKSSPDSPWPKEEFKPFERCLPGFWFPFRSARIHYNWRLPDVRAFDVTIVNTLTVSLTGQILMRRRLRGLRWLFWGEKLNARSRKFTSAPLRSATAIAGIGRRAQQDYAARFPGVPTINIPYHCALQPFLDEPKPTREHGTITYLFCGQMIARKGLDVLLAAFAKLPQKAKLLLVGREADLPAMLNPLPHAVRSRIHYAGFQSPDSLPKFFAQADVFVLPSRYDGWGVVVNQALGAGLPIIVSDQVGAGDELVKRGSNGFTFQSGNITDLSEKMRPFLHDDTLAPSFGAFSRGLAPEWFPEQGAQRWVDALRQILETPSGSSGSTGTCTPRPTRTAEAA